ncbi:hypothetical protein [Salinispora tropica]|uniref:Uncharacterized protein n=1 Tax=Salinispora tropica (strain ATCC BAA-916 / DSM 44818 / JCM 13857 / NBRC 105044 / CNB-440) TaxID=369723 RepID=A4X7R9_SALTO|nr:hypothetical protein [Salinispora tropica]ABP54919.1 hypothetical protein Strop_2473 [Salinispora tropica CNB-440]
MSDTTHNRPAHGISRPDDVSDPLLWGLALNVADAHQPDAAGTDCVSLLCTGQGWPCTTWQSAQRALRVAQTPPGQRPADRPEGRTDEWSAFHTHPPRATAPEPQRRGDIAA